MNAKKKQLLNTIRELRKHSRKTGTISPSSVQAICPSESKPASKKIDVLKAAIQRRRILLKGMDNMQPNMGISKFMPEFNTEFEESCQGLMAKRARLIEEAKNEYVPGEDVPVADALEPTNVVFGNNVSIPISDETTDMDAPTAEEFPMENASSIESTEEPMKKVFLGDDWITSDKLVSDSIADKSEEVLTEKEPAKESTPKFSGWGGLLGTRE